MPKLVHKSPKLQPIHYSQSHPLPEMNWLACGRLTSVAVCRQVNRARISCQVHVFADTDEEVSDHSLKLN
jgi:hypothetical protein